MALYKAQDILVGIDGSNILANNLSFRTSPSIEEKRRLGKEIEGDGFAVSGPQSSSISLDFYIDSSIGNIRENHPVIKLLKGLDLDNVDFQTNSSNGEELGKLFKINLNNGNSLSWDYIGQDKIYSIYPASGQYYINDTLIATDSTGEYPWESTFTNKTTPQQRGQLGCITGSKIQIGGQDFASGAALTNLSFSMEPFQPIIFSANFEIFNPVTSSFPSSPAPSSSTIDALDILHGYKSNYYGSPTSIGIDETTNISYNISAQREPVYVIGSNNVHEIITTSASKSFSIAGFGFENNILNSAVNSISLELGSHNTPAAFLDTIEGRVTDDSFTMPDVGIIRRSFSITENLI